MSAPSGPITGLRTEGPWPFVTLRSYVRGGRHVLWLARQDRKGLIRHARERLAGGAPFWRTAGYNWWTGALFAVGSLLFILGAVLSLLPQGAPMAPSVFHINLVFFAGSIPFTVAGYMQLFQAANAPGFAPDPAAAAAARPVSLIGWSPRSPGWLSAFAQFVGTVAFNFNTFDAIHAPAGWIDQDLVVWAPGVIGSALFLVSGYLAFVETCHGYWAWRPKRLDWWIVFVNLLGCIFFMTAGLLAYVPKGAEPAWIGAAANVHLALGALGFLIGAVLMMVESAQAARGRRAEAA